MNNENDKNLNSFVKEAEAKSPMHWQALKSRVDKAAAAAEEYVSQILDFDVLAPESICDDQFAWWLKQYNSLNDDPVTEAILRDAFRHAWNETINKRSEWAEVTTKTADLKRNESDLSNGIAFRHRFYH